MKKFKNKIRIRCRTRNGFKSWTLMVLLLLFYSLELAINNLLNFTHLKEINFTVLNNWTLLFIILSFLFVLLKLEEFVVYYKIKRIMRNNNLEINSVNNSKNELPFIKFWISKDKNENLIITYKKTTKKLINDWVFENLVKQIQETTKWIPLKEIEEKKKRTYYFTKNKEEFKFNLEYNPHHLVVGKTGSGKTQLLKHWLKTEEQFKNKKVFIIDFKNEFKQWENIKNEGVLTTIPKTIQVMRETIKEWENNDNMNTLLVFDEYLSISIFVNKDPKLKKEWDQYFEQIILLGRSKGVNIICLVQNANASNIPTFIRDQTAKVGVGNLEKETKLILFNDKNISLNDKVLNKENGIFTFGYKGSENTTMKTYIQKVSWK